MPHFTLKESLYVLFLIAVSMVLGCPLGWSTHYAMIESLSYSPNNARILVSKLNAVNAGTPMKAYKADVSRTLCWLDVADGKSSRVIHQDLKPGNAGPAFKLWRVGRT